MFLTVCATISTEATIRPICTGLALCTPAVFFLFSLHCSLRRTDRRIEQLVFANRDSHDRKIYDTQGCLYERKRAIHLPEWGGARRDRLELKKGRRDGLGVLLTDIVSNSGPLSEKFSSSSNNSSISISAPLTNPVNESIK